MFKNRVDTEANSFKVPTMIINSYNFYSFYKKCTFRNGRKQCGFTKYQQPLSFNISKIITGIINTGKMSSSLKLSRFSSLFPFTQ